MVLPVVGRVIQERFPAADLVPVLDEDLDHVRVEKLLGKNNLILSHVIYPHEVDVEIPEGVYVVLFLEIEAHDAGISVRFLVTSDLNDKGGGSGFCCNSVKWVKEWGVGDRGKSRELELVVLREPILELFMPDALPVPFGDLEISGFAACFQDPACFFHLFV